MSADTDHQSASEVAHEAEDTRAHLASTLEQLRDNLKPEHVMEEVVSNARIGASSVADTIAGVARQYPIPAMLIVAGSALVLRFFSKRSGRPAVTGFEALDRSSGPVPSAARRAPPRASVPRPPMLRNPSTFRPAPGREGASAFSSTTASVADTRDGLVGSLSAQGAALKRQASDIYDSTSSQAGDAMQNVSRYLPHDRSEVKSKLSNLLEEQPLILGAIGLAIGAAIGAAVPITETEDSLMGSTAHRLRDTATDVARHEVDGLRTAAGEAIDSVRHSAKDNLNDFVKDVGESARTVVGKAGDSLGSGSQDL